MKPLVDKQYRLERFPGKGGWTFARIPEVEQDKSKPFGWVTVRGTIDGYEIQKHRLAPMGGGKSLFLPVRAEIRKKINKKEGDNVHVVLYLDDSGIELPEELRLCLEDEPGALNFFESLSDSEKKAYIDWIYSARKEDTRIERMADTVNRLLKGLKRYDK